MVSIPTILLGILLNFISLDKALDPSEVMNKVTKAFGKAIYFCQGQMGFSNDVILKIRHFWHEDYEGTPQEMACVIRCAMKRLELIDDQGNLNHAHVVAFVKANGADGATAKRLLETVTKDCTNNNNNMADVPGDCLAAMEMANCLRTGVHKMHIEPPVTETEERSTSIYY